MVETTYRIPNAPRLALLADLHGRPYEHVIASVAAHRPELIAIAGDILYGSVDLVLSGHAHGGQWRVFSHGVWCPGQGLWPKYTKGVYEGRLVVSAGLANTAKVPRLFNPTETVFIESP